MWRLSHVPTAHASIIYYIVMALTHAPTHLQVPNGVLPITCNYLVIISMCIGVCKWYSLTGNSLPITVPGVVYNLFKSIDVT